MATRRRRKPGTPEEEKARKEKFYFNQGTHDAIVAYQKEEDVKVRNKLYLEKISPAFHKLAENLINLHRFVSQHETFESLKADTVCFLFEALRKFDPERGSNAFSYMNVIAKNFLIVRTKNKINANRKMINLDDPDSLTQAEHRLLEEYAIVPAQDTIIENSVIATNILDIFRDIRHEAKTDNELTTINGVIDIFESIDDIDILNKSSATLYLREITNLSNKQLSTALAAVKKLYKERQEEDDDDYV